MNAVAGAVLVLNSGSSSLKYQLLHPDSGEVVHGGIVERIGEAEVPDHKAALRLVFDEFAARGLDLTDGAGSPEGLVAVGHRVVHGGRSFHSPTVIDDHVLAEIRRLSSLAPLHNPANLMGIEACEKAFAGIPNVAVFDTAFHHSMPPSSYLYAIPY